jgi:hypothetical protein
MTFRPTVLEQVLNKIPWGHFDQLVEKQQADRRSRSFDSRSHLITMISAHLTGLTGLRAITGELATRARPLDLVGGAPPGRSTLAEANQTRPADLFIDLFNILVGLAHRPLRRDLNSAIRLIDATPLDLGRRVLKWLPKTQGKAAAKLHLVFDPEAAVPVYFSVTSARVNDITPAKELVLEPGATYVFDLGYYDFGFWARLDAEGCRLVTRLKSYTNLTVTEERPVPQDHDVLLSDRVGHLPERMASQRRNPFARPGREVTIRIDSGKTIRVFTNDLDSPAEVIADLYKQRWQIELFFKWIRQNLQITRFIGHTDNAVRIQIVTGLIAYLLIRLIHAAQNTAQPASALLRLISHHLFERRSLATLLHPPRRPRQPRLKQGAVF